MRSRALSTAYVAMLTTMLAALPSCGGKESSRTGKAAKTLPAPAPPTVPVVSPLPSPTPPVVAPPSEDVPPASVGVLELSTAVGLARADSFLADGSALASVLVRIDADGSLRPVSIGQVDVATLALEGEPAQPDEVIDCVRPLGAFGTLVRARVRSSSLPLFSGATTELALIDPAGSLRPLTPAVGSAIGALRLSDGDCVVSTQLTQDGSLYALGSGGNVIWKIDLASAVATATLTAAGDETYTGFLAIDSGDLFYESSVAFVPTTRWRNSAGVVVDLGNPNNAIRSPRNLGNLGFTFITNGYAGGEILSVENGGLLRSFVEPLYGADSSTFWGAPTSITIGDWAITRQTALRPTGAKMASNPFWRSYGRFQGLIDSAQQLYFDGSNVVNVSHDATKGLLVKHHRNILQPAAERWKVVAVFGPAQGFTTKWVGFATEQGFLDTFTETAHLLWVEIDPATGKVDPERVFRLQAANMPSHWNGEVDRIPEFTPYLVPTSTGTKLVGLGGTIGAGVFDLVVDETEKTVTLGATKGGAYTYEHPRALIDGSRLYFNASFHDPNNGTHADKVYYYDAETDHAATTAEAILPGGGALADVNPARCNAMLAYGLIAIPGDTGPAMIFCDAAYKLRMARFTDFTFTTLAGDVVQLPVEAPRTNDNEGDFATGTVNNTNWMQTYALDATHLAIGLGRRREVRLVTPETGAQTEVVRFDALNTENRFEFGRIFTDTVTYAYPDTRTIAPWDATRLFAASTTTSGVEAAYLVDLELRSLTRITDLDGLVVDAAVRLDANQVLIAARHPSNPGEALSIILSNDGETVETRTTAVALKEIAPKPPTP